MPPWAINAGLRRDTKIGIVSVSRHVLPDDSSVLTLVWLSLWL